MRIIWEKDDIQIGAYIIRNSSPKNGLDTNFACTVTYKIGFQNGNKERPLGLISCLTDGWYLPIGDEEAICEQLNKDEFGYRPLTKAEYIRMIESTEQGFIK